jgi:hypothetical protein
MRQEDQGLAPQDPWTVETLDEREPTTPVGPEQPQVLAPDRVLGPARAIGDRAAVISWVRKLKTAIRRT